jgi:Gas vesicle synthesis protein GvpO
VEALMATKRDEAQKRRAEERRKRRASSSAAPEEPKQEETGAEEPLDTVKHAAKVAAAAAAVGAAMGAARAMTGSGEDHDEPAEPDSQAEQPEQREQPEPREQPEQPEPEQPEPRAEREQPREEPEQPREPEADQRPSGAGPRETRGVVEAAREQLAALLGKEADSVSRLDRNGDGWVVTLEIVEVARIPESTDVLASYEVELDGDRNLVRYARRRRYYRSQADDGESS